MVASDDRAMIGSGKLINGSDPDVGRIDELVFRQRGQTFQFFVSFGCKNRQKYRFEFGHAESKHLVKAFTVQAQRLKADSGLTAFARGFEGLLRRAP